MNIIGSFVNKCFSLARLGKCWYDRLLASILEAGRTISYVQTTSPSQADTLHAAVKDSDIRCMMREYERIVRQVVPQLHLGNVMVAFDTTEEVTWCKSNQRSLRPSVYDHPLSSWQFLNVSIVEPCFVPLMSIPYRQIDDLDTLVINLLGYVSTLSLQIKLLLFDRGFYHAHLIDYLNNRKGGRPWPYLMLVPEREAQERYIQQTRDAHQLLASFHHVFDYKKDKSSWHPSTTIVVRIVDEEVAWCYATNRPPTLELCMLYPKRWCIETGFRTHDEVRIKSKSLDARIRFFYHLLGMLIVLLWRVQNTRQYMIFKQYVKQLEVSYSEELKHPPPL